MNCPICPRDGMTTRKELRDHVQANHTSTCPRCKKRHAGAQGGDACGSPKRPKESG